MVKFKGKGKSCPKGNSPAFDTMHLFFFKMGALEYQKTATLNFGQTNKEGLGLFDCIHICLQMAVVDSEY